MQFNRFSWVSTLIGFSYFQVTVFIESDTTTAPEPDTCSFSSKQYNADIYENVSERTLLIDLNTTCESNGNALYAIAQGSGE